MRELTDGEILGLADEVRDYELWEEWTEHAKEYFGDKAHKITVGTGSEYNDEGGYYDTVESVTVCDADDNEIEIPDDRYDASHDARYELSCPSGDRTFIVGEPPKRTFAKVYVD